MVPPPSPESDISRKIQKVRRIDLTPNFPVANLCRPAPKGWFRCHFLKWCGMNSGNSGVAQRQSG